MRDASHEYECISKQGERGCYGAAAVPGVQRGWRFAEPSFPKTAILHPPADPLYLGIAETQGTDPAAANGSYIASLDGAEEILNHSDKDKSVS